MTARLLVAWAGAAALVAAPAGARAQVEGRARASIEAESRGFPSPALSSEQGRLDGSAAFRAQFSLSWADRAQLLTFEPFLRLDAVDGRRTHADLRVLSYERAWRDWELRVGVRRVFWGVTESKHLVDIVNQTDLVENVDGEDKLGQPMVNLAWIRGWGTVDLFVLTGFRQRTFPGLDGRLRAPVVIDPDFAVFETDGLSRHLALAVRWTQSLGAWDLGVAHFHGTSREPRFEPVEGASGSMRLAPHYDLIDQTSIDAQWTTGGWLWKLEGITRTGGPGPRVWALVTGFEYTLYQLFGTAADLGLLTEVLLDTRETEPFEDDVFLGARLALNDVGSTTLLAGGVVDRSSGATLVSVEAGRRLGERWTLEVEARAFVGVGSRDPFYGLRRDGYVSLAVTRWF